MCIYNSYFGQLFGARERNVVNSGYLVQKVQFCGAAIIFL